MESKLGRRSPGGTARRLLLVIPSLEAGGAERVMSVLAGLFAARGYDTHLALLAGRGVPRRYNVPPTVTVHELGPPAGSSALSRARGNGARLGRLSRIMRNLAPDAAVSFMEQNNVITLAAAVGTGVPVIISERVHPLLFRPHLLWRLARPLIYPRCAFLVVQTEEIARLCGSFVDSGKIRVIPNPVPAAPARALLGGKRIVAAGRLARQKGFDLLLRAFAALASDYPGWRLDIFGEGEERPRLEALCRELGLTGAVRLAGLADDLWHELATADIFALPSRFEGFPNALAEAMSAGLPAVASRCSGALDLIEDGVNGILVDREATAALEDALRRLMGDRRLGARLGARATEVSKRFGPHRVLPLWEDLISACSTGR